MPMDMPMGMPMGIPIPIPKRMAPPKQKQFPGRGEGYDGVVRKGLSLLQLLVELPYLCLCLHNAALHAHRTLRLLSHPPSPRQPILPRNGTPQHATAQRGCAKARDFEHAGWLGRAGPRCWELQFACSFESRTAISWSIFIALCVSCSELYRSRAMVHREYNRPHTPQTSYIAH